MYPKDAFQNCQAIIFDLDGTLADTMPLHYQACQDVCLPLGFSFPKDFFLDQAGVPTIEVFTRLFIQLGRPEDPEEIGRRKENRFLELIPKVRAIPEVLQVVKDFSALPLAIGSGGERRTVDLTLEALDLNHRFDAIVTSDDVQEPKPSPETFLKCAKAMNVPAEACVVLEDGDLGLQAAHSANMRGIDIRPWVETSF